MKEKTKQDIGFPSLGIGLLLIVWAVSTLILSSPPMLSLKQFFISVGLGVLLISFGLFLTWPRTKRKK